MPMRSSAVDSLPAVAANALMRLGADLSLARKRRKQSLRTWATRLNVSVPTLMKMEKGDPTVSIGVYATALWMIQRQDALAVHEFSSRKVDGKSRLPELERLIVDDPASLDYPAIIKSIFTR